MKARHVLALLIVICTLGCSDRQTENPDSTKAPPVAVKKSTPVKTSASAEDNRKAIEIEMGMPRTELYEIFDQLGATEIQLSTKPGKDFDPNRDYTLTYFIRHIKKYDISLEGSFEKNKLTSLRIWDWKGFEPDTYMHMLEFHEASSLHLNPNLTTSYTILKTHYKGKLSTHRREN